MADRQCGQLFVVGKEEWIGHDHEPTGSQFNQGCECSLDLACAACMEDMELQPEGARRCLHGSRRRLSNTGIGRVDEQGHVRRAGHHLMQHLEQLRPTSTFKLVTPVTLLPGRFRLATSPTLTGSVAAEKTIGSVVVSAFAASADEDPAATIRAT